MEFYIKKNATLPFLKIQIFQDGRSDFENPQNNFSGSTFYISLIDTSTNVPHIIRSLMTLTVEPSNNGSTDNIYFLNYQFKNNQTKNSGRFFVSIELENQTGIITLPLPQKLFVNIQDSFILDNLSKNGDYTISIPCC